MVATEVPLDDKRNASVSSAPNYNLASEHDAADLGTEFRAKGTRHMADNWDSQARI